ncbi:hypothetical protein GCM10009742_08350 [Kribbella karoonensis]|uniref:Sigma-70-like protein n=2 Tax=Kribbella karoonensis TaxID=324851 RepID=A0ABN2D3X0_9ACTN
MPDRGAAELYSTTWSDAFPWLARSTSQNAADLGSMLQIAIAESDLGTRRLIVDSAVAFAVDRLKEWPLGEVFPLLPLDVSIEELNLPVRAYNCLSRAKRLTTRDMVDLSLNEFLKYRNAGIETATAILRALADRSTWPEQSRNSANIETAAPSRWADDLVRDIEALARWNHLIGQIDRGVLAPLTLGAPKEVVAAHDRLVALSAADVLPGPVSTVANVLEEEILGMDERHRTILTRRLFAWDVVTLDVLGREFGVSRERVRQLESKARDKLRELVAEGTRVGQIVALMRSQIRGVRPLTEVLAEVPALGDVVGSVGQPAWRIIDILDDTYEIANGWCAEPSLEAAKRETGIYLDELADEYGVVRLADVGLVDTEERGTLPWLTDWLTHIGYEVRGGSVLLRTTSVGDVAAAVLSIEGGPLTLETLFERVGRGSIGNLRNQLNSDRRFHKVDIEHWALTSWGLDSYTNIRAEIGKLIEQAGGELGLAVIVDSLVGRFGVSASSVNVYAGSAPYELRNGMVRAQSVRVVGGKNPAKVQGYYCRGDDWLYRTTVTHDHLRGSGWSASTAVATLVGLSQGEHTELPTRLGPQKFSWRNHQPAFGSIKRLLDADRLGVGDEIFLIFRGDGTFDVQKLPDMPEDSLSQALRLVGADMSLEGQDAIDALALAIKHPAGSDLSTVAAGYKAKRDQVIRDLLVGGEPD